MSACCRWAQDGSRFYGEALHLMRVDVLNTSLYHETLAHSLRPTRQGRDWNARRMHHADLRPVPMRLLNTLRALPQHGRTPSSSAAAASAADTHKIDHPDINLGIYYEINSSQTLPAPSLSGEGDDPAALPDAAYTAAQQLLQCYAVTHITSHNACLNNDLDKSAAKTKEAVLLDDFLNSAGALSGDHGDGTVWVGLVDGDMYPDGMHHFRQREWKFVMFKCFLLHLLILQLLAVCGMRFLLMPYAAPWIGSKPWFSGIYTITSIYWYRLEALWKDYGTLLAMAASSLGVSFLLLVLLPNWFTCPRWFIHVSITTAAWDPKGLEHACSYAPRYSLQLGICGGTVAPKCKAAHQALVHGPQQSVAFSDAMIGEAGAQKAVQFQQCEPGSKALNNNTIFSTGAAAASGHNLFDQAFQPHVFEMQTAWSCLVRSPKSGPPIEGIAQSVSDRRCSCTLLQSFNDKIATAAGSSAQFGSNLSASISADLPGPYKLEGLVVVTGATEGYYDRLENLVGSLHVWEPHQALLVFDLGLTAHQLASIRCWRNVAVLRFPFEAFPDHVHDMHTYAFKALAIELALQQHPVALWLDSGLEVGPTGLMSLVSLSMHCWLASRWLQKA